MRFVPLPGIFRLTRISNTTRIQQEFQNSVQRPASDRTKLCRRWSSILVDWFDACLDVHNTCRCWLSRNFGSLAQHQRLPIKKSPRGHEIILRFSYAHLWVPGISFKFISVCNYALARNAFHSLFAFKKLNLLSVLILKFSRSLRPGRGRWFMSCWWTFACFGGCYGDDFRCITCWRISIQIFLSGDN